MTKKQWIIIITATTGGIISLWFILGLLEMIIFNNADWEWEE